MEFKKSQTLEGIWALKTQNPKIPSRQAGREATPWPKATRLPRWKMTKKAQKGQKGTERAWSLFDRDRLDVSRFGQKRVFGQKTRFSQKRDTSRRSTKKADWRPPKKAGLKFDDKRPKITPLPRHLFWPQKIPKNRQKVPFLTAYKFFRWGAP